MKKHVLLVSHYSGYPGGPVDKFSDYLKKDFIVNQIKYPLWPKARASTSIKYKNKTLNIVIPYQLQYFLEGIMVAIVIARSFRNRPPIELAICFDSLSFIHTYFFNFVYKSKKLVFYNIDYSQKRFSNPVINFVYQSCNKFAYKKCDYFFSLYSLLIDEIDTQKKLSSKSFLIKSTIDLNNIKLNKKRNPNSIVYAGVVEYGTVNFDPFLLALQKLKKNHVPFVFDLYGKITSQEFPDKIKNLGLEKEIRFKGTLDYDTYLSEVLPTQKIGVAPYALKESEGVPDHVFLGTDLTSKLVDYLGAGLPMISTPVNDGFNIIRETESGFLVTTEKEWFSALKKLLTNKAIYKKYQKNALQLAKSYDIEEVLGGIMKKVLAD